MEVHTYLKKAFATVSEKVLVGFYGGSFLNLPIKKIAEYFHSIPDNHYFYGVRISTTFQSIKEEKLSILTKWEKNIEFELGLETLNNQVQKIITFIF